MRALGEVFVAQIDETGLSVAMPGLEEPVTSAWRGCQAEALRKNPAEAGWVVLRVTTEGWRPPTVLRAELVESGGLSPGTVSCGLRATETPKRGDESGLHTLLLITVR